MFKSAFKRPTLLRALLATLSLAVALPALADPPSHAPAHGWRKKHDPYYQGYTGKQWRDDYGITSGHCDGSRIVSAMTGKAVGDAIGGDAGTIIGAVTGVLVAEKVSRKMDKIDRGCLSHALDLGRSDQPVRWTNPETHRQYSVTPRETRNIDGRLCRDMDWSSGSRQTACINSDGSWSVMANGRR